MFKQWLTKYDTNVGEGLVLTRAHTIFTAIVLFCTAPLLHLITSHSPTGMAGESILILICLFWPYFIAHLQVFQRCIICNVWINDSEVKFIRLEIEELHINNKASLKK